MAGQWSDADAVGVVSLVRPELRGLLRQYRIPADGLVELLERAVVAAVDSWDAKTDKAVWLLATVESECSAYWRDRGLPAPGVADAVGDLE